MKKKSSSNLSKANKKSSSKKSVKSVKSVSSSKKSRSSPKKLVSDFFSNDASDSIWKGKYFNLFLLILGISLVLRVIYAWAPTVLWWDEAIYLGMAKWMFSGQVLGYWESFRPVALPVLLGAGWFVGLPIVIWGKFLELFFSLGIITLVYYLGEKIYSRAGLFASAITASLPMFFSYGNKLLTGIPSTFFTLLAFYFLFKKKWYWAGLVLGVAFLMRFLFAFAALAVGLAIVIAFLLSKKLSIRSEWILFFKKIGLLLGGFFTFVLPYFIYTQIAHGNFLYPIQEGSRVFHASAPWIYDLGNLVYIKELFIQNIFLSFFLVGLVLFAVFKLYRYELTNALVLFSIFFTTYLFAITHKEIRYLMPSFIMLSLLAGIGLAFSFKKLKLLGLTSRWLVFGLIFIVLGFILLQSVADIPKSFSEEKLTGVKYDFYTYFSNQSMDDEMFIASSPLFVAYTDKPITMLRSWELAPEVYSRFGNQSDFMAIDTCDKPCEGNLSWVQQKDYFLSWSNENHELLFNESYVRWDSSKCDLFVWSLNDLE